MIKQRIKYIDALRGFTMTLVVLGHVFTHGLGMYHSFISQFFMTFRMPMFFFISGYIAYKSIEIWTPEHFKQMLKKKAVVQIIPATIFLILFTIYWAGADKPIFAYIQQQGIGGYWFTYTLLAYFIIYYCLSLFAHQHVSPHKQDRFFNLGMLITALIGIAAYVYMVVIIKKEVLNAYALTKVCYYFQFFMVGIFAKKYQAEFEKSLNDNVILSVSTIVFVACLYLLFHPGINTKVPVVINLFLKYELVRYPGVILVFALFYQSREVFNRDGFVIKSMLFVGRRTLDIYLIHYFLIPELHQMKSFFASGNLFVIELFLAVTIAILIIAVCLCISRVIRLSSFLGYYLLGAKKN